MICISRVLLEQELDKALKMIYCGDGLFVTIDSISLQLDCADTDDEYYGVMEIRYGRFIEVDDSHNFEHNLEIQFGPKDIVNLDFFRGMAYYAMSKND